MPNVRLFPNIKKDAPCQSLEEIRQQVIEIKLRRIEDVAGSVVIRIFEEMKTSHGYDFFDVDTNKELSFAFEAVKSAMMKHDGMEHPFQEVADKFFDIDEDGEICFLGELSEPVMNYLPDGTDISPPSIEIKDTKP